MEPTGGISGFERNATAALHHDGAILTCAESRARRVRGIGIRDGGWPSEAVAAITSQLDVEWPAAWSTAERAVHDAVPGGTLLAHHATHARTAFFASGFADAIVLVCDSQAEQPESLWLGGHGGLRPLALPAAHVPGVTARLSRACTTAGLRAGELRELETLARQRDGAVAQQVLQQAVDEVLALASYLREMQPGLPLCVGGGLFLNGYLNLELRRSGLFTAVYVPPDPSNAGLAVGCAIPDSYRAERLSAFLGPSFEEEQIKRVLDNCKLTYRYVSASEQVQKAAEHLRAGRLIGCFKGAMEWGPRALGHRSILASASSKYVSHNLNEFLKHRPGHHTYSIAVLEEQMAALFRNPVPSPYMEAEAEIAGGHDALRHVAGTSRRVRVQSVGPRDGLLGSVLRALEHDTVALVNTSFNGFHEPIVATPRDAVRVFYGTGLDAMAIGNFWLEK